MSGTNIYGIRCKATGEFVVYNSKCAWTKKGNAKNAWANAHRFHNDHPIFDGQDDYEIVDLVEYYYMYKDLCE